MNRTPATALALLGLIVAGSCPAWGGDRGFYVGVDAGQSTLDRNASFDFAIRSDRTASTFTVRGGYRFNRYFALEGGYTDLGDFSATIQPPCTGGCPTVDSRISIDGVMVNAVGIWPLSEHFALRASAGAIYRWFKGTSNSAQFGTFSETDEGTVYKFGAGFVVPINEHFEIGADYTWYREIGVGLDSFQNNTYTFNHPETRTWAVGLTYRF
jgi:OmpA-OmpF porin, OOP family